ncbi:branched-chain amino acid transaminase [Sandaracinus amylolyticus]|uniref:branched-chain amino acid transaminase n=1 Tax=Sandaracinus amylolyticus TaxID=927083 RepID=UPI001F020550|nr:branched-chain amino acid transaminase [Sandaracinus amylolyticus]UJR80014.1 Branched-chain-amino-acid aminotransferase [Sandaracinus amylolyticus]
MVDRVAKIWMDGRLVDWDAAQVHVLTHTLHYGLGTFEGIRAYETHDGRTAIFRLREHVRRLFDSAKICTIPMPYTQDQIVDACIETVRANGLSSCYLRPLVFLGDGAMGLGAINPTRVSIAVWKWGAYLGEEGLAKGIRAKVSSFTRPGINMLMSKGKVSGHYVNSVLAKREAIAAGYQEAIMLDAQGRVSEATGENVWLVRDGVVATAPYGGSILGGITRDTLLTILRKDLGVEVQERDITRDELWIADEVFMCGTAAEVTPVREIDDRQIGAGARGPLTKKVQDRYFEVVRGVRPPVAEWLTYV